MIPQNSILKLHINKVRIGEIVIALFLTIITLTFVRQEVKLSVISQYLHSKQEINFHYFY